MRKCYLLFTWKQTAKGKISVSATLVWTKYYSGNGDGDGLGTVTEAVIDFIPAPNLLALLQSPK